MKTVYSSPHLFLVYLFKDILDSHHIPCIITNLYLSGAAGELPPTEVWPSLRVENDEDFDRASQLVSQELKRQVQDSNIQAWSCPQCGELIEGQFNQCWRCGTFSDKS